MDSTEDTTSRMPPYSLRSKLLDDFRITISFIGKVALKKVNGFSKSMAIMVSVFLVRAIVGGNIVPQAISRIVNALKDEALNTAIFGFWLFIVSAIIYAATEFILFKYFKKLAETIIALKKSVIDSIRANGISDSPEDVVGRISSDIDFVIWNMNAVLVTLLPNIFTGIVAAYTVLNFNMYVGLVTVFTLTPYLMLAEYYSRRVEIARLEERHEYSVSIAYIRDVVYWRQENGFLSQVLSKWYRAILRVMWYDRVYWGVSFFTQFTSIGIISFVAVLQAYNGAIDVGSLAGIISATINAHSALLNAMWALCIQGQNVAAIKRIYVYFHGMNQRDRGVLETPLMQTMRRR